MHDGNTTPSTADISGRRTTHAALPGDAAQQELATRLRGWRKRRGLTQAQLAREASLSKSMVAKLEQGIAHAGLETVHRLARALRIQTTELFDDNDDTTPMPLHDPATWDPVARALAGQHPPTDEPATVTGITAILDDLKPLLAANRYAEVAQLLPSLIRDADTLNGEGRAVRSRVLNTTGWVLVQNRQFAIAEPTLRLALDAADDRLDAAAAVNTMVWLHLRRGRLTQAARLAAKWADDIEPRMSRATLRELTLWGRLLLGISNAAVRDNRPGEADDALQLAKAAAVRIGREVVSDTSTTRTFGPATVSMIQAENAAVQDKPDRVLSIAERIAMPALHARSASRNRHRLDVAAALVATHRPDEGLAVLSELAGHSPQWLAQQQYAGGILGQVIGRRRTLTAEMRRLADLLGVAV